MCHLGPFPCRASPWAGGEGLPRLLLLVQNHQHKRTGLTGFNSAATEPRTPLQPVRASCSRSLGGCQHRCTSHLGCIQAQSPAHPVASPAGTPGFVFRWRSNPHQPGCPKGPRSSPGKSSLPCQDGEPQHRDIGVHPLTFGASTWKLSVSSHINRGCHCGPHQSEPSCLHRGRMEGALPRGAQLGTQRPAWGWQSYLPCK